MEWFGDTPVGVELARGDRGAIDELFEFYDRSGFLYPEKRARVEPDLDEIKATLVAAVGAPEPLYRIYLARDEAGRIVASHSAVRYTEDTWWGHSTASDRHLPGLRSVSLAVLRHLARGTDSCRFLKAGWRPDNSWPERQYSSLLRNLPVGMAHLETYDYAVFDNRTIAAGAGDPGGGLAVVALSELGPRGYFEIAPRLERALRRAGHGFQVAAENLDATSLLVPRTAAAFARAGLSRRREVWVCLRGDEPVAAAVADSASPGLHLSHALDKFRLFALGGDDEVAAAAPALVARCARHYQEAGRAWSIGYLTSPLRRSLAALPHAVERRYRNLLTSFTPAALELIEAHTVKLFDAAGLFVGKTRRAG